MGFYIIENSEPKGPFTIGQMRSMWNSGVLNLETKFCQEGDSEWTGISVLLPLLEPAPTVSPVAQRKEHNQNIAEDYHPGNVRESVMSPPAAPPVARSTLAYKIGRAIGKPWMDWRMRVVIVGIIVGIILGLLWLVRDVLGELSGGFLVIGIYFLPSLCAIGKRNAGAIFLLNLLLGWTLVGWVIALVWSAIGDKDIAKI